MPAVSSFLSDNSRLRTRMAYVEMKEQVLHDKKEHRRLHRSRQFDKH